MNNFHIHVVKWLQRAILLWMPDPAVRDATVVRKALSGDVIDLKAATEVICSRTSTQIQHFKQIYHAKFHAYLEHDIEYQASGDLKKVQTLSLSLIKCSYLHVNKIQLNKLCFTEHLSLLQLSMLACFCQ